MTDQEQFAADAEASTRARNGEKLTPDEARLLAHMAAEGDVLHDGFSRPKGMSAKRAEAAVLGLETKGSLWCSCFQDRDRAGRRYIGGHVYRVRLYQPRKRRKTTSHSVQNVTKPMPQTPMPIGDSVMKKREVALGVIRGSESLSDAFSGEFGNAYKCKGGRPRLKKDRPRTPAEKMRAYRQRKKDAQRAECARRKAA